MDSVRVKLAEGGRIVIPAEYRKALGLHTGDPMVLSFEDGELRLLTMEQSIRRAQEIIRECIPEGRSLSDELIAERRAEAARE